MGTGYGCEMGLLTSVCTVFYVRRVLSVYIVKPVYIHTLQSARVDCRCTLTL